MASLPTNAEIFNDLLANTPNFTGLYAKNQADFVANCLPAMDSVFNGEMNEVVTQLVNRVSATMLNDLKLKNPLSSFEMAAWEFGAFMQEYAVFPVEELKFRDPADSSDQFTFTPPNVKQAIYKISRKPQYKTSLEDEITRQAFLNENGLSTLLRSLLGTLHKSNERDTFIYMKKLFSYYLTSGAVSKTQIIPVPDLRDESLSANDIRTAISRIKKASMAMTFNSDNWNAAKRVQAADLSDLVCIMDYKAYQQNEVQNLSQSFNTNFLDYSTPVIQLDNFENEGIIGVLTDKRAFGFHNMAPPRMTNASDAKNLHTNYFYTLVQMYHASPFCNSAYLVSENYYNELVSTGPYSGK